MRGGELQAWDAEELHDPAEHRLLPGIRLLRSGDRELLVRNQAERHRVRSHHLRSLRRLRADRRVFRVRDEGAKLHGPQVPVRNLWVIESHGERCLLPRGHGWHAVQRRVLLQQRLRSALQQLQLRSVRSRVLLDELPADRRSEPSPVLLHVHGRRILQERRVWPRRNLLRRRQGPAVVRLPVPRRRPVVLRRVSGGRPLRGRVRAQLLPLLTRQAHRRPASLPATSRRLPAVHTWIHNGFSEAESLVLWRPRAESNSRPTV